MKTWGVGATKTTMVESPPFYLSLLVYTHLLLTPIKSLNPTCEPLVLHFSFQHYLVYSSIEVFLVDKNLLAFYKSQTRAEFMADVR